MERFSSTELTIIYIWNNQIKCHSIVRTNIERYNSDTCFILNNKQWDILNTFYLNIMHNTLGRDSVIYVGEYAQCKLSIGTQHYTVENKNQISLLKDLTR